MTPLILLRNLIHDAIETRKIDGGYTINDFDLEQTYFPWQKLESISQRPKVWVLGIGFDDAILTRAGAFQRELPIQLAVQKLLSGHPQSATAAIDQLLTLVDELRDTLILAVKDDDRFGWLRTEALKDQNGTPYNFAGLREQNTFESIFTAFYQANLIPSAFTEAASSS